MGFLEVTGVSVQEEGHEVLRNISFSQREYQKIAIAGETGSGKSTLLQTIAGLVHASKGQVTFEGERVRSPHDKLVPGHAGIAYLSQQYELPQFLRVEQVLRYANTLGGDEAETLYEVCRISHLAKRRTNQLSGGERQRIALARLLSTWPSLLLLDEPYSNLDVGHKNILKSVIHDITERLAITCILISHDPHDTLSWADEIIVLQNGQIVQQGTPEQLYRQPNSVYTASLFGKYNHIPAASAAAAAFTSLPGIAPNGKDLLIRPENLLLTADKTALPASMNKVTFFGSHYELEAQLADVALTIRTSKHPLPEGSTVYLTIDPQDVRQL
ncbi:ABC transporter ATP-binding protein [Pontibacter roseus]|uniref:ABC transporter ATP-binding protein n=1 Tax=Pontibacter roseus TaxID=336989 RepID=UPI0003676D6E|nr:ABC transporter ATP-binding protein [Pontibacter roseus]